MTTISTEFSQRAVATLGTVQFPTVRPAQLCSDWLDVIQEQLPNYKTGQSHCEECENFVADL